MGHAETYFFTSQVRVGHQKCCFTTNVVLAVLGDTISRMSDRTVKPGGAGVQGQTICQKDR